MEVDQSNSAWLLSKALSAKNINESRAWLESAKAESPKSFNVMISAYELECRARTSPKDTANVILGLVKNEEFINEPRLWDEPELVDRNFILRTLKKVKILLESDCDVTKSEVNTFRSEVITALGPTNFRELIIEFINITKYDIDENIDLLLKLLKKYPDYIKAVGTNICDKLLIGEKHDAGCDPDMTPLNKKRHIAVNTVFPILFESGKLSTVQGKTFYKWFQKSLEYTVWYISTSKRPKDLPAIDGEPWAKLRKIRQHVAKHAQWEDEPPLPPQPTQALWQTLKWLKTIYTQRSRNANDSAMRKQTFYTAVMVYLEAAARYVAISEPSLMCKTTSKTTYSQFPIYGMIIDPQDRPEGKYYDKNFDDLCERQQYFMASITAKKMLDDDYAFAEDLQKLQKALKFNRWRWLEAFNIDYSIKDRDYDQAIRLLSNLIKAGNWPAPVLYRWRVQLGSCFCALEKIKTSVTYLYDAVMQDQEDGFDTEIDAEFIRANQMGEVEWVRGVNCDVLIIAIQAILTATSVALDRATSSKSRQMQIVGWMLVLSQYEWPRFYETTKYAIEKIKSVGSFIYPNLLDFIYEGGVIEELAWLLNQDVNLSISNAGDARELREQLIKAVRSTISPSILIRNFLIITKEDILSEMELPNR